MERLSLRAALADDRPLRVGWSCLSDPLAAEIMVRAGFEAVLIDLQHGVIDLGAAPAMLTVAECVSTPDTVITPAPTIGCATWSTNARTATSMNRWSPAAYHDTAPGLGFLLWMRAVYGDEADAAWAKLKPRIVTFTKGWSEAYGLFLKGEAEMVLSYATSPAYHLGIEKKTQYKAASFSEGHYLHVELAGMTRATKQPELAKRFLAFMLSDAFQSLIPDGNWMMPAKLPATGLPTSFAEVIRPEKTLLIAPETARGQRRAFIDAWLAATSR